MQTTPSGRRQFLAFLCLYSLVLALLLPSLPLWTDELLHLYDVRSANPLEIFGRIRGLVGSVPLVHLLEWTSFRIFGISATSGRLPSAVASLLACWGVFRLATRVGLLRPVVAVLVFALFPLQFRYAMEAREYETGLCFSIWATVFFLDALASPKNRRPLIFYALMLAGALYSQPYAGFVAAAHWLWAIHRSPRRFQIGVTAAIAAAGLAFLPWYLYVSPWWKQLLPTVQGHYTFSAKSTLLVVHELVGMGYFGTFFVIAVAAAGAARKFRDPSAREFWILYAAVPIVAALAADAIYAYFLAIRQILFIAAPLAILFAAGLEAARKWKPAAAVALGIVFFAGAIYANVRFYSRPRQTVPELQQQLNQPSPTDR